MSEKEKVIIESIRSGANNIALEYLYDISLKKVRQYILKNNGSKDDANDIFQDAVIVLFNQIRLNKFNEAYSIDAFIYSVARNLWIDKVRRDKKFTKYDSPDDYAVIASDTNHLDALIQKEKSAAMKTVFNLLDEKCRNILTYVIYEKRSMKEIKELMGYSSEDVAKTNHYRCKQYLTKLVKSNPSLVDLLRN
ncbi:RNA polymerase sigma factor [Cytophaga hutchinsonii]|uniref:RNA polymerase specialized sigma subunit n=1 Tax=Cytophaga hutchinsonii (strain ATCC 33406 / DSM 1761 / CIP 103989 / NBRC 15051 / NCIMB 9469 / D465) TaxID=269798 RepID=A0A6N4SPA1_CYTH3|nr:sigma-70 family RNA polymerase sigma factor [Cytophaga hutchinsonii]ABG58110.1 RNA polymerase specialized sigma subunit [Cytophaga hutchinsonii ATCC 33406]SFX13741.1 RNA polymerase sigma factor, sigma-70 family [Cytophaga hutchinsonii ATCC 33406]